MPISRKIPFRCSIFFFCGGFKCGIGQIHPQCLIFPKAKFMIRQKLHFGMRQIFLHKFAAFSGYFPHPHSRPQSSESNDHSCRKLRQLLDIFQNPFIGNARKFFMQGRIHVLQIHKNQIHPFQRAAYPFQIQNSRRILYPD